MKTVAIIGAGASGLACLKTLLAYKDQLNIMVFDRNACIAKKIAATGNGHCNLSNANLNQEAYRGEIKKHIMDMIYDFDIESFCFDLGFLTRKKGVLYYPYSEQAKTVVYAFEKLIENQNIDLHLNTTITSIQPKQDHYVLIDENKQYYVCDIVVVCAGGKAGKGFGTDGQIFNVLKELHIKQAPLKPSLVSLLVKENVKKLKGCRVHGTFTLKNNDEVVASYKGEALFSENGISGIACMQLSRFLEESGNYTLHCDLVDDLSIEDLKTYYHKYGQFEGIIQDKLASYLAYKPVNDEEEFVSRLKDLKFNIVGTRDFEFAQVSKGGVSLAQLNEHLMSETYPNLYFCGEVLNIDGDCGGYNLHFAFASGVHVANAIIKGVCHD